VQLRQGVRLFMELSSSKGQHTLAHWCSFPASEPVCIQHLQDSWTQLSTLTLTASPHPLYLLLCLVPVLFYTLLSTAAASPQQLASSSGRPH
jgi:hypothetical protein